MKKISIFTKFNQKETLNLAQAAQIKGGDDKRPQLPLPAPGPVPPPALPNCTVCYMFD